jgi:hypothetical protein
LDYRLLLLLLLLLLGFLEQILLPQYDEMKQENVELSQRNEVLVEEE